LNSRIEKEGIYFGSEQWKQVQLWYNILKKKKEESIKLLIFFILFQIFIISGLYSKTPKILWTIQTGDEVGGLCIWDGKVYFGSDDGKLYCVKIESKKKGMAFPSISGMDTMIDE